MKKKLLLKFILVFLGIGAALFLLVSTYASGQVYYTILNMQGAELYDEAIAIARECSASYNGDMHPLSSAASRYEGIAQGLNGTVWIIDTHGTVIYDTSDTHTGRTIASFTPSAFGTSDRSTAGYLETGTMNGFFNEKQISVMTSIISDYTTHGYVMIHIQDATVQQLSYQVLNIVYIMSGIVFLATGLILLVMFYLLANRPINKIIKAADAYATGDLKYRSEVRSADELGYLSATLNYMAQELDNTEEYQRQFISNVSHDFRSPLTSIKGYLNAILDGTIPPEMYDHYLGVVINETDRLNKLTYELLTLNQVGDGNKIGLNISDFDINRTIRDTCATFEGQCKAKRIRFNLTFDNKVQMVRADMGKIQQVVYNLIDNAIKFSKPDTSIDIETMDKNGKVFVSVKDHGCGISKQDQKKIFERFYKADNSRGKDRQGTGLGLAITKEIITAHGQTIDVVSTPDVGTDFTFTIAKSAKQTGSPMAGQS